MDPTLAPGERGGITANDLAALGYFAYQIKPDAPVLEVLSVDDNSREQLLPANTHWLVNRVTPARVPFNLQTIRVQLPPLVDGSAVIGKPLRVIAFADPARTGQPPNNPTLLAERTLTLQSLPESRWLEVLLPAPVTINGGDLYVGVQAPQANLQFAADENGEARRRSFLSSNNGASFQPLQTAGGAPLNLLLRAAGEARFNGLHNLPPELLRLSQTVTAPGADAEVLVYGRNFLPAQNETDNPGNSVVRLNGRALPTVFRSASQLRVRLPASELRDGAALRLTALTPTTSGGLESNALTLNVSPNAALPLLTQLEPAVAAVGSSQLIVKVRGRDFKTTSVVRWNGANRSTTFISGSELQALLPTSDLAAARTASLSVFTPAPGGGASNELSFNVAGCTYALSKTSASFSQTLLGGHFDAFWLETPEHCPWTARSNANWLGLQGRTSGQGRFPLTYTVANNPTSASRTGTLTIAGQTFTVNQKAGVNAASAASFRTPATVGAIASVFGAGLAKATQAATTTPLPVTLAGTKVLVKDAQFETREAPLFFVSPTQINLLIPPGTSVPDADSNSFFTECLLSILVDGALVAEGTLRLAAVTPGFFTADASGQGLAAGVALRVKADGSQSFEPLGIFDPAQNRFNPRPIDLGPEGERVFLVLFGTGFRRRSALEAVSVRAGNIGLPVVFAGAQGSLTGVDQLNVELPRSLIGRGNVTLNCTMDGRAANPVMVAIQ